MRIIKEFEKTLKLAGGLSYILIKNNIQFTKEDKEEVIVPIGQQIVCFSPKGKVIFAENTDNKSVHFDLAKKINPSEDKIRSMMELVKQGFIFFGDISDETGHYASLCYLKGTTTKIQHERLKKIQNEGYEFIDGGLEEEEFYELYPYLKSEDKEEKTNTHVVTRKVEANRSIE